jgi:hypothetical protein
MRIPISPYFGTFRPIKETGLVGDCRHISKRYAALKLQVFFPRCLGSKAVSDAHGMTENPRKQEVA